MVGVKIPTIRLANVTAPAAPRKASDGFQTQVSQQTRRIAGDTPKLLGAGNYPHLGSPAKLIPKTRAFANLAGMTKRKSK